MDQLRRQPENVIFTNTSPLIIVRPYHRLPQDTYTMSSSAQLSTSRRLQDLLLQLQSFEEGTYKAKDIQERTALYLANERQSPSALHAKVWKTVPTTFLQLVATADESYVMSLASVAALESIHQTNVEPKKIERRRRMLEIMLMCIIGSCDLSENRMEMIRLAKEDQTEYLENQEESRVGQSEKQRTASCRQKAHLRSKAMEAIRRRFKEFEETPTNERHDSGDYEGVGCGKQPQYNDTHPSNVGDCPTSTFDKLPGYGYVDPRRLIVPEGGRMGSELSEHSPIGTVSLSNTDTFQNNVPAFTEGPTGSDPPSPNRLPEWYDDIGEKEDLPRWSPSLGGTTHITNLQSATTNSPSQGLSTFEGFWPPFD